MTKYIFAFILFCFSVAISSQPKIDLKSSIKRCNQGNAEFCGIAGILSFAKHNYGDAEKYLKKSCEGKHGGSCHFLARMYLTGVGLQLSEEKAVLYEKKGCDLNVAESCYILGLAYGSGHGVPMSLSAGKYYLRKACSLKHQESCDFLARH